MSNQFLPRLFLALAFLGLSRFSSLADVQENSDKATAIWQYKLGDYLGAIKNLQLALAKSPNDGVLHYYLANCWVQLNRLDSAAQEYQAALNLPQEPLIASYCRAGLAACTTQPVAQPKDSVPAPKALSDKEKSLTKTLQTIEDQTDSQKRIRQSEIDTNAQASVAAGDFRVRQLEVEREQRIQFMERATYRDSLGFVHPTYSLEEIQYADANYQQRILDARATADSYAKSIRAVGQEKTTELEKSAKSLEDQLKNDNSSVGFKLLPLGTNLYVRNYLLANPADSNSSPQEELTATQEQLLLFKHSHTGAFQSTVVPAPLSSNPGILRGAQTATSQSDNSFRTTSASVYGKILPSN